MITAALRSVGLASGVDLGAEICGGRAGLGEVAREDWLEEGAEDDLGATACCQCVLMGIQTVILHTQSGEEPSRGQGRT